MHIADFDEPRLRGPAVGCGRIFVEHGGGVVNLGTTFRAFVGDKSLDRGTHPGRFGGAIGLQLGNPPVFIGVVIVSKLIDRFLWPMAFVLDIGGEADLERPHVGHAFSRLGTHRKTVAHGKENGS